MIQHYEIVISKDALDDIKSMKGYILKQFKYCEYAENFSKKIKQSIQKIKNFPKAYEKTGYQIEGLDVFVKPCDTYLIFFVVDDAKIIVLRVLKDRMYWKSVIERIQN